MIKEIKAISRNFLWAGVADYVKSPPIDLETCSSPNLKVKVVWGDLEAWTKALVFKHIRTIIHSGHSLWVNWIHTHYLN